MNAGRVPGFEADAVAVFVAVERLTDHALPVGLACSIDVAPHDASFGFRPVYVFGRLRNDSKAWSSAQFIRFETA